MIELDQGGASLTRAMRAAVPSDLAEWVDSVTLHEGGGPRWKIVADDAPHVIFSQSGSAPGGPGRLTVVGARSRAVVANLARRRRTVVLRLRPGALEAVAGIPGRLLTDRSVSWADATGDREARERLGALEGPGADSRLLRAVIGLVRDRIDRAGRPAIDWRIRALLAAEVERTPVGTAQRRAGVPARTLHRTVHEAVGLPPSTLIRIRRLHRALLDAAQGGRSGSRLALRHGYGDQSHWIRECRAFMGESPGAFLRRRFA